MRRYSILVILYLIIYTNISAATNPQYSVIGTWEAKVPDGKTIVTFVFKENGSIDWIVTQKASASSKMRSHTAKAKYTIRPGINFINIDVYGFDVKGAQNMIFLGIIQFKDKDTILMEGRPGPKSSTTHRPKAFSKQFLEFKKK